MKITKEWLEEQSACSEGQEWFLSQEETEAIKVLKKLINQKHLDWANWTIVRVMDYKQRVSYAVCVKRLARNFLLKRYKSKEVENESNKR